jgi:transposase
MRYPGPENNAGGPLSDEPELDAWHSDCDVGESGCSQMNNMTGTGPMKDIAGEDQEPGAVEGIAKLETRSLHPRLAWMMVYEETHSVSAVCSKFNISRKTFYKWLKRYQQASGNSASLADRSRRPHHFPRATPSRDIALLQKAKDETGFGQRRLRAYLEEKYNITLSERTIWKILKQHGPESREAAAG